LYKLIFVKLIFDKKIHSLQIFKKGWARFGRSIFNTGLLLKV